MKCVGGSAAGLWAPSNPPDLAKPKAPHLLGAAAEAQGRGPGEQPGEAAQRLAQFHQSLDLARSKTKAMLPHLSPVLL